MPGHKPTATELVRRYRQVALWLAELPTKSEVKKAIQAAWGVHWKTAENYIARAREQCRADVVDRDIAEHVRDAYYRYLSIANDEEIAPSVRVKAQMAIDRLLGLHTPSRGSQATQEDETPETQTADQLADIIAKLQSRAVPEPSAN